MQSYPLEPKDMKCPYMEEGCKCLVSGIKNNIDCPKFRAWLDAKNPEIVNKILTEIFGSADIPSDKLNLMMDMQKYFYGNLIYKNYNTSIDDMPVHMINDEMLMLERACGDELSEIRKHLNWKNWKKPDWTKFDNTVELEKEVIDMWHFVMDMMIILKMSPKAVCTTYIVKNVENKLRQEYGY